MLNIKKGTSIISLVLCAVAVTLVTTALVMATNNAALYNAQQMANRNYEVIENNAYIKVYKISEIENLARQAFANNYLAFNDKEVDLEGFEALVIGEMMQIVPQNQLEDYYIQVTQDGVKVNKI